MLRRDVAQLIYCSIAVLFLFLPALASAQCDPGGAATPVWNCAAPTMYLYINRGYNYTYIYNGSVVPANTDGYIASLSMPYYDSSAISWSTSDVVPGSCHVYAWWGHYSSARDGSGTNIYDGDYQPSWLYMNGGHMGQSGTITLSCTSALDGGVYQTSVYADVAAPPAPTCSVWADASPIAYGGSTTLRWSYTSAFSSMYMTTISWLPANTAPYTAKSGSATVAPTQTTTYTGTANGAGGTGYCSYTLTVNPAANCTAPWGATVNHGSSVTAYQTSTVPSGSTCNSQTRTCSNGTLSGTYQYQSCAVAPSCSIAVAPTSIAQGGSAAITWSSTNATSCTGTNFSTGGLTQKSAPGVSVNPSQSTTYTASCTGAGGTAQCSGSGSGGIGTQLTVSCTPTTTWTCDDTHTIASTTMTAQCTPAVNHTTCSSPQYCLAGSATCVYDAVAGSILASPRLVGSGKTTTITWSASNAVSCTVRGSNGDEWHDTPHETSPITEVTQYTLSCDDADPDTTEDVIDHVTVVRIPSWLEL